MFKVKCKIQRNKAFKKTVPYIITESKKSGRHNWTLLFSVGGNVFPVYHDKSGHIIHKRHGSNGMDSFYIPLNLGR